jgi:hypothetical protein
MFDVSHRTMRSGQIAARRLSNKPTGIRVRLAVHGMVSYRIRNGRNPGLKRK